MMLANECVYGVEFVTHRLHVVGVCYGVLVTGYNIRRKKETRLKPLGNLDFAKLPPLNLPFYNPYVFP